MILKSPAVTRHGYYVAATKARYGDAELSTRAEVQWAATGHGVSIWEDAEGRVIVRVVMRGLFARRTVAFPPCASFEVDRQFIADIPLLTPLARF